LKRRKCFSPLPFCSRNERLQLTDIFWYKDMFAYTYVRRWLGSLHSVLVAAAAAVALLCIFISSYISASAHSGLEPPHRIGVVCRQLKTGLCCAVSCRHSETEKKKKKNGNSYRMRSP
jgi:hypothetical protein